MNSFPEIPPARRDQSSSAAAASLDDGTWIDIVIRHKIRGGGGAWVDVATDERLRVSDLRTGKNLRLVLSSLATDIDWEKSQFFVMSKPNKVAGVANAEADWTTMSESDKSFQIKEKRGFITGSKAQRRSICHLDLKLFVMYRTIKFRVVACRPGFPDVACDSFSFVTYNSGTAEAKRQARVAKESSSNAAPKKRKATKRDTATKASSTDPIESPPSPESVEMKQEPMDEGNDCRAQTVEEQPPNPFRDAWTRMEGNLSIEGVALAQRCMELECCVVGRTPF